MTLPVGSSLGPFKILARLGAGGMGEVYRARDLRLNRELAIKVLPESLAKDAGFLARFQSEAQAASALNHPNIVTIHDVGSSDGVSYILMELVDGKTVRELLHGGAPPLRKAVEIASQVAEGLAAAHAKGIVHRDLKPENLIVSRDGIVKILDFGIAKATPLDARPGEETAPLEVKATQPGSVLGTVGYMSPEQAAGRAIDFRSDQFALGTILYELLTGRRPWKRDSAAETLTAIIREEPQPPIAAAAPSTPTALRWILDRCLAKDPEERYASSRDLARDLGTVKNRLGELRGVDSVAPTRAGLGSRLGWRAALAAVLAAAALASGLWLGSRLRHGESKLPQWTQFGFRRGTLWHARFAPDGQTVVYSAAWDGGPQRLFSTRPGSTETRTLELPPGLLLAISSKSEVAFLRNLHLGHELHQPGTLVRAGLEAGVGRDVLENVYGADWSPDGTQLAVARGVDGKVRLEYPIGKTIYETDVPIRNLRISRDGAWIAFYEPMETGAIVAVRVSDGLRRVLSQGWFITPIELAWSPDGSEVWFTPMKKIRDTSPAFLAATLSGKLREIYRGPGQLVIMDVSPDGHLLITRSDAQLGIRGSSSSAIHDRELSATDDSRLEDLSSDGRNVLLFDRSSLYLRPMNGSPPLRLGESYTDARLSPDGNWVVTDSPKDRVLVPVGAGDVRRIEALAGCHHADWLPDGRRLLCEVSDESGFHLSVIDVASGKPAEVALPADAAADFEFPGPISADGTALSGVGRSGDVWVLPLAGGEPRRFALEKGLYPVGWTAGGQGLFLHRIGSLPASVFQFDLRTGEMAPWKQLAPEDLAGVVRIDPVRVADDGRAWAFSYIRVLSNLYVVDGLK